MKIFLDADIKTNPVDSANNSAIESPFSKSKKTANSKAPAFLRKDDGLRLNDIIAIQHPVMISWLVASFILISATYIYSVITL